MEQNGNLRDKTRKNRATEQRISTQHEKEQNTCDCARQNKKGLEKTKEIKHTV